MWGQILKLTASAIAFAFAAGCGQTPEAASSEAGAAPDNAEASAVFGDGPAMWRLADDDSEIYLFGTFHLLPDGIVWDTPAFDAAMAATETTVTEADATSPEAQQQMVALVQQYGLNPEGVTLSSTLGPERAAQLQEVSAKLGVPYAALEPYKPWLALVSLSTIAMQQLGFDPTKGVESVVMARATEEGDAIEHLETAEYQIKLLATLDEEEMLGNFDTTIEQFADFGTYVNKMLTAWQTGDIDTIADDFFGDMRKSSPKAFDAIIVVRNRNWAEEIDALMQAEGDYFIAVGAGHLAGDDSVVDMLQEKGYNVERVQ